MFPQTIASAICFLPAHQSPTSAFCLHVHSTPFLGWRQLEKCPHPITHQHGHRHAVHHLLATHSTRICHALCASQNGSKDTVAKLVKLLNGVQIPSNTDVCVAPPSLYLDLLKRELNSSIHLAAQNVSSTGHGAYTGEINAEQLADFGIEWTLVGHSERRQLYGATDEVVKKQINQCVQHKLHVIACIGETEDERKANRTFAVLDTQLAAIHAALPDPHSFTRHITIAYEPVWAIGTGQTATAQQAQEVHSHIRQWLSQHVGPEAAHTVRLIYGGSVTSKNAVELIQQVDVDGFLVGGASLKEEFADIIKSTQQAKR